MCCLPGNEKKKKLIIVKKFETSRWAPVVNRIKDTLGHGLKPELTTDKFNKTVIFSF